MRFDFLEVIEDSGSDVLRSIPGVSFELDVNNTMGSLPGDATIRLERVLSDIAPEMRASDRWLFMQPIPAESSRSSPLLG